MTETPAEAWLRCSPYIEAALAHEGGGYTLDDVANRIAAGHAHFWPGRVSAIVTEFWIKPRLKSLNFWLGGGDVRELVIMREHIETWAKTQGCAKAQGLAVYGRNGWTRILKGFGYRPTWTYYAKDLT